MRLHTTNYEIILSLNKYYLMKVITLQLLTTKKQIHVSSAHNIINKFIKKLMNSI